jgi:sugar lactone lactonase YvrE
LLAPILAIALTAPLARAGWTDAKAAVSVLGQSDFGLGQVNGGGAAPSAASLNSPGGIARDPITGKLFVCDTENNRILRFSSAAAFATGAAAEAVLGQSDFATATGGGAEAKFNRPDGVHVDSAGRLWVADTDQHRVLMYLNASTIASGAGPDGLLGSPALDLAMPGNSAGHMTQPRDVACDNAGRLWVADWGNHRVLRFDDAATKALANAANPLVNTAPADSVLGQTDFGLSDSNQGLGNATVATMNRPWKLEVDPAGNLWVSDTRNDRLLYFINPGTKANGAGADGLLGVASFEVEGASGIAPGNFSRALGMVFDPTGALWVADHFHHRVLRFDTPAGDALANAADPLVNATFPDGILGQPGFDSGLQSLTADGLVAPTDIAVSPYGDLWVVQSNNVAGGSRVSRFRPDPDSWRSDVLIGTKKSSLRGNDLYNLSGGGQTVSAVSKNLKKLTFFFHLQNDGIYSDDLKLLGSKGNRDFKVTYFETISGKRNVTGAMTSGSLRASGLLRGTTRTYLVEGKPGPSTRGKKKSRNLTITGTSLQGGAADRVKAKATTAK